MPAARRKRRWVCGLLVAAAAAGCAGGPGVEPACDGAPAAPARKAPRRNLDAFRDFEGEMEEQAKGVTLHLDRSITVLDEALVRRVALSVLADIATAPDDEDIPSLAEDLRFRLLDEYREGGYHFADVDVQVGPRRPKGSRRIDIAAVERERVMVDAVEITGARAVAPSELRDYYHDHAQTVVKIFGRSVYNSRVAEDAARRMVERYEFEGYPDATARIVETRFNRARDGVVLRYAVGEGPRAWLQKVDWKPLARPGEPPVPLRLRPWEIRDQLRAAGVAAGVPYSPSLAGTARSALAAYYAEEGFPFALVQAVETRRERDRNGDWQVTLELLILENEIAAVCRIGVSGNHWTHEEVIRREVSGRRGEIYTASRIRDIQRALNRLGLFKNVQVRRIAHPDRPDLVDLDIAVTEQDWVVARMDVGFASVEGVRAAPTLDFPNFTAFGHSAQVRALLSPLRQRVEGKLTMPWTFGVPVRTRVETSWEDRPEPLSRRPSFRAEEARAAVTFSRPIIGDLAGFVGYETETTRVFDPADGFLIQSSIGISADATVPDLRLSAVNFGWELDGRDNRFNPRTGAYATMRYTFAGGDLGGNVDFQRLEGTIAMYASSGPFTLALRGDSSAVSYDASAKFPTLPPPYRVFSGGARSVRSFTEGELGPLTIDDSSTLENEGGSPLGGLGHGVVNAELRTRLWQYEETPFGVSLLLFADAGSVWPYRNEGRAMVPAGQERDRYRTRATDVAFALGWGLRLDTFIGPIGFQMGWNPDRYRVPPARSGGRPRHEDAFAFFFQVGNTF